MNRYGRIAFAALIASVAAMASTGVRSDEPDFHFRDVADETGVASEVHTRTEGADLVTTRIYHTPRGDLTEQRRFVHGHSTLVQERFLLPPDPSPAQLDAFDALVQARRWLAQKFGSRFPKEGGVHAELAR